MIVEKEFLSKIRDLGINSYEAKLWTALLSRGVATAGELSDIANVPRSRSYDVLESLERKGFIVMKLGKPIQYIAVSPQEVIERVKGKIREDAQAQDRMLEELKSSEVIQSLHNLFDKGSQHVDPAEITGIVRGQKNVVSHMQSVMKKAKKSVKLCVSPDVAKELKRGLVKATKNGAIVQVVSSQDPFRHKDIAVRNCSPDFRFVLADDEQVVMLPHDTTEFAVWIHSDVFAKNFSTLFSSLWKK
ncbi:hypothetical protein GF342_01610 [Candidatus Woesearchaeota archaeon]|nr:hypothetical protein [Candidatus Woesearchaeota archaeon]